MTILTLSRAKDSNKQLSPNFKALEFACKDMTDRFLVDELLVYFLQKIRDQSKAAIIIHSSYRTAAHNKKEGGSPNSQHLYGMAADFHVVGVPHLQVAQYAESLGIGGIGLYSWGVHIDTRSVKTRWDYRSGKQVAVNTFGGQAPAKAAPKAISITVAAKPLMVLGKPLPLLAGLIDNENYVHLRDLAASTCFAVEYDATTKKVKINTAAVGEQRAVLAGTKKTSITIEAKTFYVNGAAKQNRAGLIDNENYVHLRDFCTAAGLTVEYDAVSKQIRITE